MKITHSVSGKVMVPVRHSGGVRLGVSRQLRDSYMRDM